MVRSRVWGCRSSVSEELGMQPSSLLHRGQLVPVSLRVGIFVNRCEADIH